VEARPQEDLRPRSTMTRTPPSRRTGEEESFGATRANKLGFDRVLHRQYRLESPASTIRLRRGKKSVSGMLVPELRLGVAVMLVAMEAAIVMDRERVLWRVRRTEFDLQTRGSDLGSSLNVDML